MTLSDRTGDLQNGQSVKFASISVDMPQPAKPHPMSWINARKYHFSDTDNGRQFDWDAKKRTGRVTIEASTGDAARERTAQHPLEGGGPFVIAGPFGSNDFFYFKRITIGAHDFTDAKYNRDTRMYRAFYSTGIVEIKELGDANLFVAGPLTGAQPITAQAQIQQPPVLLSLNVPKSYNPDVRNVISTELHLSSGMWKEQPEDNDRHTFFIFVPFTHRENFISQLRREAGNDIRAEEIQTNRFVIKIPFSAEKEARRIISQVGEMPENDWKQAWTEDSWLVLLFVSNNRWEELHNRLLAVTGPALDARFVYWGTQPDDNRPATEGQPTDDEEEETGEESPPEGNEREDVKFTQILFETSKDENLTPITPIPFSPPRNEIKPKINLHNSRQALHIGNLSDYPSALGPFTAFGPTKQPGPFYSPSPFDK